MATQQRGRRASSYLEPNFDLKKCEKPAMKRCLRFYDKNLEETYQNSQKMFRFHYLRLFLIVDLISTVVTWFINPLSMESYPSVYNVWIFLNLSFLVLCFVVVTRKREKFPMQIGIFLMQIYVVIGYSESSKANQNHWGGTNYILSGVAFELVMLSSVLAKCNWILSTLSAFILNVYLDIRATNIYDNVQLRGYPTCLYMLNAIFISLWSFIIERYDRKIFYQQKVMEKTMQRFEEIIKEVIPTSIVIAKKGKVIFFNEETSKLFQIHSKGELEEKFRDMMLEEKPQYEQKNNSSKSNPYIKNNYQNVSLNSENELINMLDLIVFDKTVPKSINMFLSYTGAMKPSYDFHFCENLPNYLDVKVGRISWEGEDALIVILTEDVVSERMKYLTEQANYKDTMLATVSHDLRTPLNGIIGIIEMVLETLELEETRKRCVFKKHYFLEITFYFSQKSLNIALRCSKLLLFMINDILDFSQINHGKLRIQPIQFDIVETVQDVSKLIKFQVKKKGLKFEFINLFQHSDKTILYNDPNRLKQIILNLLGNALKFTEKGCIRISVGPGIQSSESKDLNICSSAMVSVEDTGCGIKEQDIPKLFNMFGKLDDPTSMKLNNQGVGLGLAISQNLLRQMNLNQPGEEIKVSSEYGKGSLFYFNLSSMPLEGEIRRPRRKTNIPLQLFKQAAELTYGSIEEGFRAFSIPGFSTNAPISHHGKAEDQSDKRILLVDDDQVSLMVLKKYLSYHPDFKYDLAFNGKQAVETVMERASVGVYYELILMDCNMPVMDGYEATQRIITLEEAQIIPKLYIIALTAGSPEREMQRCLKVGMVDCVSKPLSKNELIKKLTEHRENLIEARKSK